MKAGFIARSPGLVIIVVSLFLTGCSDDNPVDSNLAVMNISPSRASREVPFGGLIGDMPVFEVRAVGSARIPFVATTTAGWINLLGGAGITPDFFTASLLSNGLNEGLYVDSIMIASEMASNSPQYVVIEWTVTPTLIILPSEITYWVSSSDTLADTALTIESAGIADLTFQATESAAWFDLANASGATPGTLTIQYTDLSTFVVTQLVDTIDIYSPEVDKNYSVPITLNITKWTALDQAGVIQDNLKGISFADSLNGWAVASRGGEPGVPNVGIIYRTSDGGINWESTHVFSGSLNLGLGDVSFVNKNDGWVVGRSGLVRQTRDGGVTWKSKKPDGIDILNIQSVHFISPFIGWIAGQDGAIFYTSNAGTVWSKSVPVTNQVLSSIFFVDASNGWAVGNAGVILSSTDGGKNWTNRSYVSPKDFRGVSFVSRDTGWVVGESGTIMATTNGGITWKLQASPSTNWLSDVQFVNSSRGWIVGENGVILITNNGGETWIDQSLRGNNPLWLHAVDFINSSKGWIAGDNGTVYVGEFAP